MKLVKAAAVASLVLASTTAFAGNPEPAPMDPTVVIDEVESAATSSSGGGLIIPLILVALIAAAS